MATKMQIDFAHLQETKRANEANEAIKAAEQQAQAEHLKYQDKTNRITGIGNMLIDAFTAPVSSAGSLLRGLNAGKKSNNSRDAIAKMKDIAQSKKENAQTARIEYDLARDKELYPLKSKGRIGGKQ